MWMHTAKASLHKFWDADYVKQNHCNDENYLLQDSRINRNHPL